MKLQGEHVFEAPRPMVWEALLDPEVIARVMPGCKALEKIGDDAYQGEMKIKVGPVQGDFKGEVTLTDLDPPSSYRMKLSGKGAPGFVEGEGDINLTDADDGGTRLAYDLDAKVGGRIASVGQRLLDSSARVIARQSLEGLDAQIAARHAAAQTSAGVGGDEAAPVVVTPPEAPSDAEMAAKFAKGLAEEMVPPERRPLLIGIGIAVVLGIGFLIVRACGS